MIERSGSVRAFDLLAQEGMKIVIQEKDIDFRGQNALSTALEEFSPTGGQKEQVQYIGHVETPKSWLTLPILTLDVSPAPDKLGQRYEKPVLEEYLKRFTDESYRTLITPGQHETPGYRSSIRTAARTVLKEQGKKYKIAVPIVLNYDTLLTDVGEKALLVKAKKYKEYLQQQADLAMAASLVRTLASPNLFYPEYPDFINRGFVDVASYNMDKRFPFAKRWSGILREQSQSNKNTAFVSNKQNFGSQLARDEGPAAVESFQRLYHITLRDVWESDFYRTAIECNPVFTGDDSGNFIYVLVLPFNRIEPPGLDSLVISEKAEQFFRTGIDIMAARNGREDLKGLNVIEGNWSWMNSLREFFTAYYQMANQVTVTVNFNRAGSVKAETIIYNSGVPMSARIGLETVDLMNHGKQRSVMEKPQVKTAVKKVLRGYEPLMVLPNMTLFDEPYRSRNEER